MLAWVPPAWQRGVEQTLAGLAGGHPSRAILLLPRDEASPAADDPWLARAELRELGRDRVVEVDAVELPPGAQGAASIAGPLILADLSATFGGAASFPRRTSPSSR